MWKYMDHSNKEHIFSYLGLLKKIDLLIEERERVGRAEEEGKRIPGRLPTRHGAQCRT